MPFEISQEHGYLMIRLTGVVPPADLVELRQALQRIEEHATPLDRLIDLTDVQSTSVAFPEVVEIAEHRRVQSFAASIRSAIVTGTPRQYGFARMFQTLNDNPHIEIRIFDSREKALAWIRH